MPPPKKRKKLCRVPLGAREVHVIRRLKNVLGVPVTKIALATERNKTTVYEALDRRWKSGKRGPKDKLTNATVNLLVRTTKAMIKKAAARKEVTLAMIMRRCKVKASERCVRMALQKRNIRFRPMRTKLQLSAQDVKDRFKFAKKYRKKSRRFWRTKIQMSIDLKTFKVYPNHKMRAYAASREVRGTYRAPGDGLGEGYVVVPKHMRMSTGVRSVKIVGGVGKGRVLLWHDVGKKWNGKVCAELYKGPILSSLRKAYPRKRTFEMLEDNDPTGFMSTAGVKAKKAAKINKFTIPKRSPDLSVLDYAIWKEVDRRMRFQERRFKKSRKETRAAFIGRLQRTAKGLPATFVNKAIGNMKERCERLFEAKGRHFEEGGKSYFVD